MSNYWEEWEVADQLNNLATQFEQGNVVPVIGPEFLVKEDNNYPGIRNPEKILLKIISKKLGHENVNDFSELIYDKGVDERKISYEIANTLNDYKFTPSSILKDFLQLGFPFVITTSFTPIIEKAMEEIWREGVNIKIFDNNPQHLKDAEIKNRDSFNNRSVYYMFGKANAESKAFVKTDSEMLCFCLAWMDPNRHPKMFSDVLRDKYLLFLGNGYSDWEYRFIWFSLKYKNNNTSKKKLGDYPGTLININNKSNEQLMRFIKRIDAYSLEDPYTVINLIKDRCGDFIEESMFKRVSSNPDVFISYSWTNAELAEKLYKALKKVGIEDVWYDKKQLGLADNFINDIKRGIKNATCFIPLITKEMENETRWEHTYRDEWEQAIAIQNRAPDRKFIIPIIEEGMDIDKENKARVNDGIKARDSKGRFDRNTGFDELAIKIKEIVQDEKKKNEEEEAKKNKN